MQPIADIAELEAHYGTISQPARDKVTPRLTPLYRQWIDASRFLILATVGPEGTDGSPRGDDGPVVRIADDQTLLLPDWRGNNRLDSLRNIVADGRVSLLFMVPGSNNVVRVNGTAIVTADEATRQGFERNGKTPATVTVVTIGEVYFQCAKAIMRSRLWSGEDMSAQLPTAGDFIKEMNATFDGEAYDRNYPEYAKPLTW
ncbi:pyridoxamine 5'-phosphate oxidase family protein [Nitratireductor basaltis]|uniref:Pyridoxamine 5'-phosphate oxidase-like FMN-binding protein n=1 Tax=Nitratireductor basaltis TaxID=472175 RepID=A0A084U5A8_9HYPH|nr:pyridoxamine 5'-phosphate oxidase family protein [Nitratireductor basaltis]KFB08144.1 Pyridoxamine 5'-phosphate oxidase-like FMN-binding protein [Nitratireductor basaltis]